MLGRREAPKNRIRRVAGRGWCSSRSRRLRTHPPPNMADPACEPTHRPQLASRPCCTGLRACPAWPGESWVRADNATPAQRATGEALATHWLLPFSHSGITRGALMPHPKNRRAEGTLCPVLQVVNNRLYVIGTPELRQLDMQLHRCDAAPIAGDANLNYCESTSCRRLQRVWERHRFHVVLRFLRIATERRRLPDFELRLCLDDTCAASRSWHASLRQLSYAHVSCRCRDRRCHGVWEQPARPRPMFTMASCLTAPTLPVVQWNSYEQRDPDLSVWDRVWSSWARQAKQVLSPRGWGCRQNVAAFRGAANQLHTYNNRWSSTRQVRRTRITAANFNVSGRWSLALQKLRHPQLLNVRLTTMRRAGAIFNEKREPAAYQQLMNAVTTDGPAQLSLTEQAATFKYLLHIEGHGGWADRLKRQLFQGAATLKQSSGTVEWFEPGLVAGRHYWPVSGSLHNISAVIRQARSADEKSRRIAARALSKAEHLLSLGVMVEYMVALFTRYAQLYRGGVVLHELARQFTCWPAIINPSSPGCSDHPLRGEQLTDCGFVARDVEAAPGAAPPHQVFPSLRTALNASHTKRSRAVGRRTPCVQPGVVTR